MDSRKLVVHWLKERVMSLPKRGLWSISTEVPIWQTRHEQWLDEKQARHLMATFVTVPLGC